MYWITDKVKCGICDYVWVAVYYLFTEKLECPKCGIRQDPIDMGGYEKENE